MRNTQGWDEEDFRESTLPALKEDDPWADTPDYDELSDNARFQFLSEWPEVVSEILDDDIVPDIDDLDNAELIDAIDWLSDDGYTSELDIDHVYDAPEPLAEYDSGLSEPQYTPDHNVSDLSRRLKIDQLVAHIADATIPQRTKISDLLNDFSDARLRQWLQWLHNQDWTGHSLLLFLEFRSLWDVNNQWWESSYWDEALHCWYPVFNRGNLTLDASYDLIRQRLHCQAGDVIGKTWLEEWDFFNLWKSGFQSFASFVLFRARFGDTAEWRSELGLYVNDSYEDDEMLYRRNGYHEAHTNWVVVWNGVGSISSYE